jgi:hypothetical protein
LDETPEAEKAAYEAAKHDQFEYDYEQDRAKRNETEEEISERQSRLQEKYGLGRREDDDDDEE